MSQTLGSARKGTQIGYKQAQAIINYGKALPLLAKPKADALCVRAQTLADAWYEGKLGFTECVDEPMRRACLEALVRLYKASMRNAQAQAREAGKR